MVIIKVDILGCGISGLSTAISLKEYDKKLNVVIHEKNKEIGYNKEGRRCGEVFIPRKDLRDWSPKGDSFYNEIRYQELIIGKNKYIFPLSPGSFYVLNKPEFICQLARKAKRLGIKIQTHEKIRSVSDLKGDFIVDASGCPSTIRKELNFDIGNHTYGYQQTIEDCNVFKTDRIKEIFTGDIGYYWIFPRNPEKNEVNIGLGIFGSRIPNLKKILEKFKSEKNIDGKINYSTGGFIPLGVRKPLIYRNILFVGDAGVGAYSISGEGNRRAIISGNLAGFCIANRCPEKYPFLVIKRFYKWDFLENLFLKAISLFNKIGKKAVLASLNNFIRLDKTLNFYKPS